MHKCMFSGNSVIKESLRRCAVLSFCHTMCGLCKRKFHFGSCEQAKPFTVLQFPFLLFLVLPLFCCEYEGVIRSNLSLANGVFSESDILSNEPAVLDVAQLKFKGIV